MKNLKSAQGGQINIRSQELIILTIRRKLRTPGALFRFWTSEPEIFFQSSIVSNNQKKWRGEILEKSRQFNLHPKATRTREEKIDREQINFNHFVIK